MLRPRLADWRARRCRRRPCARAASSSSASRSGRKPCFGRGRQIDGLAMRRPARRPNRRRSRDWDEDRRACPRAAAHSRLAASAARNSPSRVPFSTRTSDLGSSGRGSVEAPRQPVGGTTCGNVRCPCWPDSGRSSAMCCANTGPAKGRHRMLRFADRAIDRGLAGLMRRQQVVQAGERRTRLLPAPSARTMGG